MSDTEQFDYWITDNHNFDHLFKVDHAKHPDEAANIGKTCTFVNPQYPAYRGFFTIRQLQFNYQGELCYRVYSQDRPDTFGCPASPSEIHIIEPQGG